MFVRVRKRIDDFEGTRYIVSLVFPSRSLVFLFPFTSVRDSDTFLRCNEELHIF
ncbi:hypothetical protein X777_10340 [Ooceraea biroi]|uniref:Uncharacterized protein n=1 Tax=Ooceraea biroi TaxID=2015173 RepID=A0A026W4S2_OOCBI|nr:hypothetical protein X777_10340 [Ooceraea biroi]